MASNPEQGVDRMRVLEPRDLYGVPGYHDARMLAAWAKPYQELGRLAEQDIGREPIGLMAQFSAHVRGEPEVRELDAQLAGLSARIDGILHGVHKEIGRVARETEDRVGDLVIGTRLADVWRKIRKESSLLAARSTLLIADDLTPDDRMVVAAGMDRRVYGAACGECSIEASRRTVRLYGSSDGAREALLAGLGFFINRGVHEVAENSGLAAARTRRQVYAPRAIEAAIHAGLNCRVLRAALAAPTGADGIETVLEHAGGGDETVRVIARGVAEVYARRYRDVIAAAERDRAKVQLRLEGFAGKPPSDRARYKADREVLAQDRALAQELIAAHTASLRALESALVDMTA